jgi:hypothetical protein
MTTPTIAQQRLAHQRISYSHFQSPGEVVQWLGALQAQDYASAEWTIGLRLPGASPATIEQAIAQRTLVRTWLLRGTLHIVTAADLKWILTLLSPTLLARFAPYYRKLELDEMTVSKSYEGIAAALQDGQQLTRKELLTTLERSGIRLEGQRASNLLNRAALDGLICLGPMKGKQQTFTLLDEWVPFAKHYTRDEALAELALRYFTSHGPATLHDFAWWTGLLMADAKAGLEAVKSQLSEESVAGKSYWRSANVPPVPEEIPSVHLLPGFDEFVLGYSDRSDFLRSEHEALITGINAVFAYTMVVDGQVVGTWKRTFRKGAVEITFSPFAPLSPHTLESFAISAQSYGDFLRLPVTITPPSF